jgi:hypothetical protein
MILENIDFKKLNTVSQMILIFKLNSKNFYLLILVQSNQPSLGS